MGALVVMALGGLCVYGFEEPDVGGLDATLGIRRRVHLVGPGAALIVLGLAMLGGSAAALTKD